jgi:hypothetical protein
MPTGASAVSLRSGRDGAAGTPLDAASVSVLRQRVSGTNTPIGLSATLRRGRCGKVTPLRFDCPSEQSQHAGEDQ